MDVCLHVCMCTSSWACLVPMKAEEGMRARGTRITGYKPPSGFWDLNLGSLEKHLTFESSSQPSQFILELRLKGSSEETWAKWQHDNIQSLCIRLPRVTACQVKVAMAFLPSAGRDVDPTGVKVALGKCVYTTWSLSVSLNSFNRCEMCCLVRSRWV